MSTVKDVIKILEKIAPLGMALDWDNPGLQVGRTNSVVNKVLFALDLSQEVVTQAIGLDVELIITHHPVIFHKLNAVTDEVWQQELLLQCAENNIAVYSMHTNWDAVKGGVNDVLVAKLGLKKVKVLDKTTQIGRVGELQSMTLAEFVKLVKNVLHLDAVTVVDGGKKVHKVALCGGAGMDFLPLAAAQGCDTFLTADIKYHDAQPAAFYGLNLVDGTHQATEEISMPELQKKFAKLSKLPTFLAKETRILKVM